MPDNNNNNRGLGTGGLFSALSGGTPAYQRSSHTAMISTGSGRSTDNPAAMSTRGSGSRALPSSTRSATSPRNTGNSRNNNNGSNSGMDIANAAMNANSNNNKRSSLDTGMLKLSNSIVTATTKIETAIVKQTNMIERQTNAMISRLETISKSITSLYELIEKSNRAAIKAADEYNAKQPKFNLLLNAFKPQVLYEQQVEFFNRWLTSKVTSEQLTTAIVGSFFKKGGIVQRMFGYDMRIARENKQAMPWTKQDDTALTKTLPNALKDLDISIKKNDQAIVASIENTNGIMTAATNMFKEYISRTITHYNRTEDLLDKILNRPLILTTKKEQEKKKEQENKDKFYFDILSKSGNNDQIGAIKKYINDNKRSENYSEINKNLNKMLSDAMTEAYKNRNAKEKSDMTALLEKAYRGNGAAQDKDTILKLFLQMGGVSKNASSSYKKAAQTSIDTLFNPKSQNKDLFKALQFLSTSLTESDKKLKGNLSGVTDKGLLKGLSDAIKKQAKVERNAEKEKKMWESIDKNMDKIASGEFSKSLSKKIDTSTSAINTSSDVITKQTSALKAVSLGLQKFVAPKNLMSILTTGLKFWSLYKTIGMGLGGIRWLKDTSVVKTIGGFLQTWVWNPVKKYLVDPLINGFKSIVNEYVDPAVTKKLVDTLDTAGAAVKTVATAMFGGDDQRAEARKRITSSIGSALKTHVVPYLVKIALAIWTLTRARSAFGSAFSGTKTFLQSTKGYNSNLNRQRNQGLIDDDQYESMKEYDNKKLLEQYKNGEITEREYKSKRTGFTKRLQRLKPVRDITSGFKQMGETQVGKWVKAIPNTKIGKFVGEFVDFAKDGLSQAVTGIKLFVNHNLKECVKNLPNLTMNVLSKVGTRIAGWGKSISSGISNWYKSTFTGNSKFWSSVTNFASKSWSTITNFASKSWSSMRTMWNKMINSSAWAKTKDVASKAWSGVKKVGGVVGRAIPKLPGVAGGILSSVGGLVGGIGKVASGAIGAVSVVGPIVMILKELFTRFIAPKLSASGVSGDDSKGIGTALKDFTVEFMSGLFDKISGVVNSYGGFKGIVKSVFAGVGGVLSGIWEGIKKAMGVNSYGEAVMKIWSGVFDMFKSIFELAMDGFTSVAKSIKRWIMTTLAKVPLLGKYIGNVEEEYRKEDIKEWRDNSIRDWIENDKDLKARYEEELKKNPNVSDTMAIMEGIIDAQTLKKIEAASLTDVINRNSTYRAAVKQAENKLKNSNNNNEGSSVPAPPPISESSANTTTTNKPQPDKKTDSFRDKVTGALSSLRTYFSSGNFKKDLGTLADNFGKFLKDTFKEMRNFDTKSVGTTFADAFGSLAGNLAGGLMGDSEAFDMFNKLEKSATAKGFTTVGRFAQKAEYTLASDVEDIAKFTGGSEEKLAEVVRILNTGVKLGWDKGSSKNGSKSGTPAELSTLGTDFGKGVASLSDSDIAFIKNANLDQIGAAAAIDVKSGVQNKPKGPVYASGLIIGSGFNTARMSSAFGDTEGRNHVHAGIDIATPGANALAPILAPFDGTLVEAGVHTGYGRTVILRHEIEGQTYTTLYGHLDGHKFGEGLSIGAKIPAGSIIGYMGTSGTDEKGKLVDGAYDRHLHFGVAKGRSMPFKYESSGIMDPVDFLTLTMAARASLAKGMPITEVQTALDNAAGGNGGGAANGGGNSKEAPKPNPTGTGEIMAAAEKTFTDSDISKILGTNRFSDFSKAEKTMLVNKIRTDPKYSAIVQKFHDDPLTGTYTRWVAGDDLLKLFNRDELKNEAKSYESDLDVLLGTGAEDIHMSTVFNTRKGGEFADLMSNDPEIQRLVAEYAQLDEKRRENGGTEEYRKKIMDAIDKNNKLNDLSNQLGLLNAGQLHMAIQNNYANKKDDHSTIAASSSNAGGGSSGIDTAFIADMCAAMMTGNGSRNRMQYSYPYD